MTAGASLAVGAFAGVPLVCAGPAGEPPTARGLRRGVASAAAHSVAGRRPLSAMPLDPSARARVSGDMRILAGVPSGKEAGASAGVPIDSLSVIAMLPGSRLLLALPSAASVARRAAFAASPGAASAFAAGGAGAEVRRLCGWPAAACAPASGITGGARRFPLLPGNAVLTAAAGSCPAATAPLSGSAESGTPTAEVRRALRGRSCLTCRRLCWAELGRSACLLDGGVLDRCTFAAGSFVAASGRGLFWRQGGRLCVAASGSTVSSCGPAERRATHCEKEDDNDGALSDGS